MTKHFNRLTAAESERLALLAEECGEVVQIIGKILRHGYNSVHPNGGLNNRELLEKELGDVEHAKNRMAGAGDVDHDAIEIAADEKSWRVEKYLHHQV